MTTTTTQPSRDSGDDQNSLQTDRYNSDGDGVMNPLISRLRGSITIDCTFARVASLKFRSMLREHAHRRTFIGTLGAYNGQQAVQYVKAGLRTVYVSGWQVAAANNTASEIYPDIGLYPVNSMPRVITEIVRSLRRADQIDNIRPLPRPSPPDYWIPIIADGESGFGGPLHAFELTKHMIESGASGIHFEDQAPHERKCGHLGGKVLVSTDHMIRLLRSARLASQVMDTDTVIIARTDAESARYIVSDADARDSPFIDRSRPRTTEGYYRYRAGFSACVQRALAFAPFADVLWFETSRPSYEEAEHFARLVHSRYPNKWLAYNCSPSFRWRDHMTPTELETFQHRLALCGYVFQFVTLAGYHSTNLASYRLAKEYIQKGMHAYSTLQESEFSSASYTGGDHQTEAGVAYFDEIAQAIGCNVSQQPL